MNSKGGKVILGLLFFLLATPWCVGIAIAEPYARTPAVPADMKYRSTWEKKMKRYQKGFPERDAIAIPPYPGAVATFPVSHLKGYNVIQLFTADPIEKVEAFYKETLSGWNYAKKHMNPCFFKGPVESFEPLAPAQQELPFIVLVHWRPGAMGADLIPDATTCIQIYYAPEK